MIIILSPAKRLEFEFEYSFKDTKPQFLKQSKEVLSELKKFSEKEISKLMSLSAKLSKLNFDRYQEIDLDYKKGIFAPALLAFRGDVYQGGEFLNFSDKELDVANKQIRILSGMYGMLRPYDLISPYRLEMGTDLKVGKNKNLYEFWKTTVTNQLNNDLKSDSDQLLINLASVEYSSAVDFNKIEYPVVNIDFKEKKADKLQTVALFSKKARGMMASFIVRNKVHSITGIQKFSEAGYRYQASLSGKDKLVFIR